MAYKKSHIKIEPEHDDFYQFDVVKRYAISFVVFCFSCSVRYCDLFRLFLNYLDTFSLVCLTIQNVQNNSILNVYFFNQRNVMHQNHIYTPYRWNSYIWHMIYVSQPCLQDSVNVVTQVGLIAKVQCHTLILFNSMYLCNYNANKGKFLFALFIMFKLPRAL